MKLNERFDVRPEKVAELKARIARLGIRMDLVEETFTRGGGKGGQKVNKTSNAVQLKYPPLELVVRCHRERRRTVNRFLALRELVDRIERALRRPSAAKSGAGTPSAEGPAPKEA
ncbi:peptide chain release factor-like protein [bacterium]|nr:MAG: peptide chain release factor-like protein [bacterium]